MHVNSILLSKGTDVVTIGSGQTVAVAADLLAQRKIGVLVVSDDNATVAGILSERDIVYALAANGASTLDMSVRDIMTADVQTCRPDESITNVMGLMTDRRIRHIPVIIDGKLGGIVSIGDVVKHRLRELETETSHLREYITH